MIRTRDFLLFALAFVFLLAGISSTILLGSWRTGQEKTATVIFASGEIPTGAEAIFNTTDYEDNAARLRGQLRAGSGDIDAGDPVFTSVDQLLAASVGDSTVSNRSIQWCGSRHNDSSILSRWPKDISINTIEGARLFVSNGETKLQLPTNPLQLGSPACIGGVVVGVTVTGALIRNDEAFRYVAMSENQIVGWALDGFPIYGANPDSSGLDHCGGSSGHGSYRYYLRANEDFVLGCFVGQPINIES